MSAKHTPAPWTFELAPSGGFDIEVNTNDLGRYMVIASRNSHPDRTDEMHANARLIAAAPDLLEALQHVVDAWSSQFERQGHLAPEWAKKARNAIAKATGNPYWATDANGNLHLIGSCNPPDLGAAIAKALGESK